MDRISQMSARLAELSVEELEELDRLITEEFERIDAEAGTEPSAAAAAALNELAAHAEAVVERRTAIAQESAEAQRQAEEARARLATIRGEGGTGTEGDAGTAGAPAAESGTPAAAGAPAPSGGTSTAPAAAAAAAHLQAMSGYRHQRQLVLSGVGGDAGRVAITAGAGLASHVAGSDLTDADDFAQSLANTLRSMRPAGLPSSAMTQAKRLGLFSDDITVAQGMRLDPANPDSPRAFTPEQMHEKSERFARARGVLRGVDTHRAVAASVRWQLPADRQLGSDAFENSKKIEAVVGRSAPRAAFGREGLTASGGVCLPVNVDYTVPTWSVADRVLRDATAQFQATRGGLRYVTPPDVNALAGATTVWTEATDANPAGATKPVLVVACGTEQLVYVDAIPTRVQFGNMQGRFAPEQVAANSQLAIDYAARVAEINGLQKIDAGSYHVSATQVLGAARDLLYTLDWASVAYRYRHRLPLTQTITVPLPAWTRALLRSDLLREQAHDNDSTYNVWQITDQQIDDWFTVRNINVVWTLDGLPSSGSTYGSGYDYPAQQFAAQADKAALVAFPTALAIPMYAEGMWQFLDAGMLDLGVVRDSLLDATNDYETFIETFEGWAYRGFTGGSQVITLPLSLGYLGSSIGVKSPA